MERLLCRADSIGHCQQARHNNHQAEKAVIEGQSGGTQSSGDGRVQVQISKEFTNRLESPLNSTLENGVFLLNLQALL